MRKWAAWGVAAALLAVIASGCGLINTSPPTITPILVTATDPLPVVPIVATETPAVTAVVPATDTSMLPTQATRTVTPSPLPPMTMTPTFTPSPTDTPVTPNAAVAYAPVGAAPGEGAGTCATVPQGQFAAVYESDPEIQAGIGCPLGGPTSASSAYQTLQNGAMVWVSSLGNPPQSAIYVLFNNGTYQRLNDTFTEGVDPSSSGATPPEGLAEPVRGFGKVWRETPGVRDALGWATSGEIAGSAQVQLFERGEMLALSQTGQTTILITGAPGTWIAR